MAYQVRSKHPDAPSIRGARIVSTHETVSEARAARDDLRLRRLTNPVPRDYFVTDEDGYSCDYAPIA